MLSNAHWEQNGGRRPTLRLIGAAVRVLSRDPRQAFPFLRQRLWHCLNRSWWMPGIDPISIMQQEEWLEGDRRFMEQMAHSRAAHLPGASDALRSRLQGTRGGGGAPAWHRKRP